MKLNDITNNKILVLGKMLSAINNNSLDLAFGKMGISLFFYHLSRFENDKKYKKLAEKYLDDVVLGIDTIKDIDIKNGVAGVGLGINYLVKNGFVNGNINTILQNTDDYLFRILSISKHYESLDTFTMIQVLYYFYVRLQDQNNGSENDYLFKELCVKIINNAYSKIEKISFGERLAYSVEYELPVFLYVLSRISHLDFYNVRIINILKELSPIILSTIPLLHSNKLYLLWGMLTVCEQIEIKGWDAHIKLLKQELNLNEIVNTELKNRNIFFKDGATSIFLLAEAVKKLFEEEKINIFQQQLLEKIEQSEVWHLLETDSQYFGIRNGLYNGFCGVALLLMTHIK